MAGSLNPQFGYEQSYQTRDYQVRLFSLAVLLCDAAMLAQSWES